MTQELLYLDVPGNVVHLNWIGFNPTSCYTGGTLPLPSLHLWKEQSSRAFGGGGVGLSRSFLETHLPCRKRGEWAMTLAGWMETARDPSMGNLMARRVTQPKSHHHTLSLPFSFFSLFCPSRASSYTQTHFNHTEAWQQISVSILNLINGNDSYVIQLSGWHFSFFHSGGNELHLSEDPASR